MIKRIILVPALAALAALPAAAAAELLPLWELGAGVAPIVVPDYRGSDQTSAYVLPLPYIVYRGKYLTADREGVRGRLFANDRLQLDLSLNGTLPVNSKDNAARAGMESLRPTVEFGPTVNFRLWQSLDGKMTVDARAPVRTSITVESSPRSIGWLFSPNLKFDLHEPAAMPGWKLGLVTGPIFSNRAYNAHFYSVNAMQATATRPAYAASGGYAGSQVTFTLSKRYARWWVGGFLRHDTLAGAVFRDSPLVRQRNAVSAGFAVAWVFGESSARVQAEE
jgi:outer membrane protein